MAIGINTPYTALRALRTAVADSAQASERISTGLRINRASDDPAGLVQANQLAVDIGGYTQVKSNVATALTYVEQVDDSLTSIADILASMKALALSSMSASSDSVRSTYNTAFLAYMDDLDTIASATTINDDSVLDGTSTSVKIQVGINSGDTKTLTFWNTSTGSSGLNISSLSIDSATNAATAYSSLDTPIDTVDARLVAVGAYETSLGYIGDFVDNMILNSTTAYDNVMSSDLAAETANLAAAEIRQNSATAMVAQANSLNQDLVDYLLKSVTD